MTILKNAVLWSMMLTLTIISCSKDDDGGGNNDECNAVMPTYNQNIKAIVDANCAISGCHGGDNPSLPSFTSYQAVFSNRSAIQSQVVGKIMPPAGQPVLSSAVINQINCWVKNGAPQ